MSDVIEVDFNKAYPIENEMITALKDVVYSFHDRVSIASALGVIEIVRHDLHRELLP